MDVKVTWRVEVLSAVDSMSDSIDVKGRITKVTWRIENFSSVKEKKHYSEIFSVDGYKWKILIYPKGGNTDAGDHLSIFLEVVDPATLSNGWSRYAQFGFAVIDQIDRRTSITQATAHEFNADGVNWGFPSFLPLKELHNPKCGYLVNDACLVEAYFSTDRTKALISHELIVKTGSEDMKTFFTGLESEFSRSSIVYSQEAAKEALAKLEEALNINPANFYDLVNFSSLKKEFKILGSLDCSSTILKIEEKNELLTMDERLKVLACRAVKAVQDKNLLAAKKSIKQSVTRNLDCGLIRFKQLEQNLDALHEQVEEAQKNRQNMLAEQMEIFKSSKKMKKELETLGKEWAEYEANAKVAEEEEKNVEVEWRRIKDFISFIKGKI